MFIVYVYVGGFSDFDFLIGVVFHVILGVIFSVVVITRNAANHDRRVTEALSPSLTPLPS
jgi:hypothetical protein